MRSAAFVLVAIVTASVAGLAVVASTSDRSHPFMLGVVASSGTALPPHTTICQGPISVPENGDFDGVTAAIGTEGRPGPALDIVVREAGTDNPSGETGSALARARLPAGYPDISEVPEHTVWLDRVRGGAIVAVCLTNRGRHRALVYGDSDVATRTNTAYLDGNPAGSDLALGFERRDPRSLASLIPAMFDRAALFQAEWIGAWTYWLLVALVVLGVPALLVGALRAAARDTG